MNDQTPILTDVEIKGRYQRRTYKAILELSARHPLLTCSDIALMTGATETWVKSIMHSDAFMAQKAALVEALHGDRLRDIQAKMETTTGLLIDAIAKRIAAVDAPVSEETLLKTAQVFLEKLFPTIKPGQATPLTAPTSVQVNFSGISAEDLQRARQLALDRSATVQLEPQHHHIKKDVIDVDEDGVPKIPHVRSGADIY